MAFSESSNPPQANSLVSFLDTASKTINGLMDKSSKGNKRKVNHKKYLQKRLQRKPAAPKAAKQPTKSKSAQLAVLASKGAPSAGVPPVIHHNSWPQLPGYSQPSTTTVEPDIDFLLQQLSSSASDVPTVSSRPCSVSSFYPSRSFVPSQQPVPPAVSLENQVLIGEQPYGSPYTPSNSSVDDFLDDSAYSSPSSSIHSSPVPLAHEWNQPPVTTAMPACVPTTTSDCWGVPPSCTVSSGDSVPPSCVVSSGDWLAVSSAPIQISCPMDQHLPTVPQLWDQLAYCEHVHY